MEPGLRAGRLSGCVLLEGVKKDTVRHYVRWKFVVSFIIWSNVLDHQPRQKLSLDEIGGNTESGDSDLDDTEFGGTLLSHATCKV